MAEMTTEKLRNVVLLSHGGAGKTALSEAMLSAAGVTSRMGTAEEGTTTSDYEPEEVRRQTSVQTAILPCPWRGHKLNVIDTPGYADFRGEAISGTSIADGAVFIVAAPSGVEVGTQQMWRMADERRLSRIVFVSKMDRENADFRRVMDSITDSFGRHCVPINLPVGAQASFTGIVSLLASGPDSPDEMQGEVEAARERLIEAVAETDDDLATKYLEGEPLTPEELNDGLKRAVAAGTVVPVIAGAPASGIGASEVMDAIVDYIPPPSDVGPALGTGRTSEEEVSLECDSGGPLAALVFKTAADPFVGKLSYFRVYSGTMKSDSQVWNASTSEAERVGQLYSIRGKAQDGAPELVAGDIGAVSKLSSVLTGHTLCLKEQPVTLSGTQFPKPVYRMAVYPKSKADVDKMTSSLARASEEDASLEVIRQPDTLEILLSGLGDTHLEVAVERMKRKFGVEMQLEVPKVPYKETITTSAKVEYRHKKQTGGHGQFGHVWLELEPRPRGKGFEFSDSVVGGVVPREYIPSVAKGVERALVTGVVAGFPIVDLKVTLVDGSYHSVDSSGISFEIAGGHALTKGIQVSNPVLLEPVMHGEITVPDSFTGDVIADLNGRRGRIQGMTPLGEGTSSISVEVPEAEMLQYATELRSQTQGLGSFTMEFDHYDEVPQHAVERAVGMAQQQREREEART